MGPPEFTGRDPVFSAAWQRTIFEESRLAAFFLRFSSCSVSHVAKAAASSLRNAYQNPDALRQSTLAEARSRLYQRRFWPPNSHFAAFFKIYKICTLLHRSELKFLEKFVQIF